MSLVTLAQYLIGNRQAVLQIANTPRAIWLGALFVLAAGFAREYDARDLSHEPWFMIVPLGASLATSFILYCLIRQVCWRRSGDDRPFWATYWQFLSLYWMTAPLALLYALPVDRFLSAEGATQANLTLLAIVSIWRVSLMIRVVNVYFGFPVGSSLAVVMFFADTVALIVLFFTPVPIFNVMGGIQQSQSDQIIASAAFFVGCLGVPLWFVFAFSYIVVLSGTRNWNPPQLAEDAPQSVSPTLWALAAVLIVGWAGILPFTQREQRLRQQVETALLQGRIAEAIETMSRHQQDDFPPHWDPPPKWVNPVVQPPLLDVVEIVLQPGCAEWVRSAYVPKFETAIGSRFFPILEWQEIDPVKKDRYIRVLEQLPPGSIDPSAFGFLIGDEQDSERKSRLESLRDAAEKRYRPPRDADY